MPEDLIKVLSPKDVADVVAWIRMPRQTVVLIDEDPSIVEALREGEGTAAIVAGDAQRGHVCLQVSPPQKFSSQIADWKFVIRENPAPGEFRYLRFAWKSDGAEGVMIELANDGRWPAAQTRR